MNGAWTLEVIRTRTSFGNIAVCEDSLLESYLETGEIEEETVRILVRERKLFPCCFGSALKMQGVEEFLGVLDTYMAIPRYPEKFGAKVYKIARDQTGIRLSYMKIMGGTLRVKDVLSGQQKDYPDKTWEEKVHQIRIYSGSAFQSVEETGAGSICAIAGLDSTWSVRELVSNRMLRSQYWSRCFLIRYSFRMERTSTSCF